ERELSVARSCSVAPLNAGPATEALYLARSDRGWVLSALGRTGEPRAHRPVTVGIMHRWARTQLNAELATDERGRIELGALPGAQRITATLGGATQSWRLDDPPPPVAALHAVAGRDVIVPVPARRPPATFESLAGAIAIRSLPPGNYQLRAPGLAPTPIFVTAPLAEVAGWAVSAGDLVQLPRAVPAIAAIEVGERLIVRLRGGDARTRVHLLATRFYPALIEPILEGAAVSAHRRLDARIAARYVSGRELGDEYRYVLERRSAPRFPGLLLDKPSLLLNPWSRRITTTDTAPPRPGAAFPAAMMQTRAAELGGRTRDMPPGRLEEAITGYDFLAESPVVLGNLSADA